jgi:acyl carrier protein
MIENQIEIIEVFKEIFNINSIEDQSIISELNNYDSYNHLTLIITIELLCNFSIKSDEIGNLKTYGDYKVFLKNKGFIINDK